MIFISESANVIGSKFKEVGLFVKSGKEKEMLNFLIKEFKDMLLEEIKDIPLQNILNNGIREILIEPYSKYFPIELKGRNYFYKGNGNKNTYFSISDKMLISPYGIKKDILKDIPDHIKSSITFLELIDKESKDSLSKKEENLIPSYIKFKIIQKLLNENSLYNDLFNFKYISYSLYVSNTHRYNQQEDYFYLRNLRVDIFNAIGMYKYYYRDAYKGLRKNAAVRDLNALENKLKQLGLNVLTQKNINEMKENIVEDIVKYCNVIYEREYKMIYLSHSDNITTKDLKLIKSKKTNFENEILKPYIFKYFQIKL